MLRIDSGGGQHQKLKTTSININGVNICRNGSYFLLNSGLNLGGQLIPKYPSKETLYRIYDEYCLFYLQFMKPFKGNSWLQLYQKPEYLIWCGYAFETICLKHSTEIKRALKIEGIASENYTWSNLKAQVDMVIDRDDNWVNLCEMKFYNDEFTIDGNYLKRLETKKKEYKTDKAGRKGIYITMVTTHGIKSNRYSTSIVDHDLKMNCLFG